MDLKTFGATFALIFLAELGDKTQLTVFAVAAGSRSPWAVFLGASAALVLSTVIAVVAGEAVLRVVPPHIIKVGAACLFFVFGVLLLLSAREPAEAAEPVEETTAAPAEGLLARVAIEAAIAFEEASVDSMAAAAERVPSENDARVLREIVEREREHVSHLHDLLGELHAVDMGVEADALPEPPRFPAEGTISAEALAPVLESERAAAGFYRELARVAVVPELRSAFAALARDEDEHIARLTEMADGRTDS